MQIQIILVFFNLVMSKLGMTAFPINQDLFNSKNSTLLFHSEELTCVIVNNFWS